MVSIQKCLCILYWVHWPIMRSTPFISPNDCSQVWECLVSFFRNIFMLGNKICCSLPGQSTLIWEYKGISVISRNKLPGKVPPGVDTLLNIYNTVYISARPEHAYDLVWRSIHISHIATQISQGVQNLRDRRCSWHQLAGYDEVRAQNETVCASLSLFKHVMASNFRSA